MTEQAKTIWDALAAPFPVGEVEVRPGATNKDKTKALALAYAQEAADAR